MARGRSSTPPRELKFFGEFYMTMFNGKISLANSESNFGFFWPPLIRTYLDLSWNILTYVDLSWHILTNRRASQPMHDHACAHVWSCRKHGVYQDYSRFETIWFRGGIKIENRENLGQCPNKGGSKKKKEMSQFQFGNFENRGWGCPHFSEMSQFQFGNF